MICSYQQLLAEQWSRFTLSQDLVEGACGAEQLTEQEEARIEAEAFYSTASANFSRLRKILSESATDGAIAPSAPSYIRLPKMELPIFDGESTEWTPFNDSFLSLVDTNSSLTNGQRLHYLRGCLLGEALNLINSLKVCDANYGEAWEILKSRYKVMRIIVEGHLRSITTLGEASVDSASAIKGVLDPVLQHASALKALGRPVHLWDDWLVHVVVHKLSFETRKHWELSLQNDELPTFDDLKCFLETRCRSLAMLANVTTTDSASPKFQAKGAPKKSTYALYAVDRRRETNITCTHCKGGHKIYDCAVFLAQDSYAKLKSVRDAAACLNCLSSGHMKAKCRSYSSCRVCHQRHYTLLHDALSTASEVIASDNHKTASRTAASTSNAAKTTHAVTASEECHQNPQTTFVATVITRRSALDESLISDARLEKADQPHIPDERSILLATAVVNVQYISGRSQTARILFDSGSHASFVTESCAQRLRLPRRPTSVCITGIGSAHGGQARGETWLNLSSLYSPHEHFRVNALVLSNISNDLPKNRITVSSWPHLRNMQFADPRYMHPGPIDILIGVDEMEQFLIPEVRKGEVGTPMAQRTVFGWTLFGCVSNVKFNSTNTQVLHCESSQTLCKLWELKEPRKRKHLTAEEILCEKNFESTHVRAQDGRFIVELPLKDHIHLGESRSYAVQSLICMERRFSRNILLRDRYKEFMRELIDLNHMEPVFDSPELSYYMPHHAVLKDTSSTTKLRVVFNASAKTSSGHSLNDALYIGPQLQDDLFSILIRFRTHRYAISADVAKMYRQVYMSEKHANLQRIVWREDPSLPIQDYRMLRVTYGVAAASHLAVKALQHTAMLAAETHNAAANVILRDFYMDDLLTGTPTVADLQRIQRDVSDILRSGGFELRKWASNAADVTAHLSRASKEMPYYVAEGKDVHALGLIWLQHRK